MLSSWACFFLWCVKHLYRLNNAFKCFWPQRTEWSHQNGEIRVFYHLTPKEHWLWQSPIDNSAFVEVQESNGEVLAHCWSKKISDVGHTEESKRKQFLLTHVTPPPRQHISVQRVTYSAHDFSHRGKWECVSKCSASLDVHDAAKRPTSFSPIQNTEEYCMTQGWEWGRLGQRVARDQQTGLLKIIKGTEILLTVSCIPSRSPTMSSWGCLTWGPPNLSTGTHNKAQHASSTYTHTLWRTPCVCPEGQWEWAFAEI